VYDEPALLAKLEPLDRWAKTAFAAACAQRLLPLFERYAKCVGASERSQRLAQILSAAWDVASGQVLDVQTMESEAESMVPSDDEEWLLETGYGDDAAAAVAYAIRTWLTDDAQEAAWAARRLYEVADYAFWQTNPEADPNAKDTQAECLASKTVQGALSALDQDLDTVASSPPSWLELRQRSDIQGRSWTATFP
jgi:uncharacterized protein YjaG (DUF416 family)